MKNRDNKDQSEKKTKTKLYLVVMTRKNNYLCILFGHGEQDKIKYKKFYFILNIYCYPTYIF